MRTWSIKVAISMVGCAGVLLAGGLARANTIVDLGIWDPKDPAWKDSSSYIHGESAGAELAYLNTLVLPAWNIANDPDLDLATYGTANISGTGTQITLMLGDYDYLKLKWDGMWQFYYIGGASGEETFDSTVFNKQGQPQNLSHYTFFSPSPKTPDGGITAGLLGLALLGLGTLRRYLS